MSIDSKLLYRSHDLASLAGGNTEARLVSLRLAGQARELRGPSFDGRKTLSCSDIGIALSRDLETGTAIA